MENKLNLELNINEINVIMNGLGNMPFVQVADLIQNIRSQLEPQLTANQPAPAAVQ
jgi:hypothetical protein